MNSRDNLVKAEQIAVELFNEVQIRDIVVAGKTELEVNKAVFDLAKDCFGIEKHWHKRIVRSGENTLYPYKHNPPNLVIKPDDILFFDFGPIVENWEADLGRTYVIGNDPIKHKLKQDIESAWYETQHWFLQQTKVTAAELYKFACNKAQEYGWEFGGEIAGHLIGEFPHEKIDPTQGDLYIHEGNQLNLLQLNTNNAKRYWILELHFIDKERKIGGFFEQLLN